MNETVLMPGLTTRETSRGFLSVDLGPEADPVGLPPDVLDEERRRLGCTREADGGWRLSWRFRKEYLRDFRAQQGVPVFGPEALDHQRPRLRDPLYRMDLASDGKGLEKRLDGRVLVWLEPDAMPPEPLGPDVERVKRSCAMGIDVSEGVGASDSAIEVFFADNREQAAEVADNRTSPADLGRLAVAMARHWNQALVCCVRRMHGITTIRTMVDECKYGRLWHHHLADRLVERKAAALGWAGDETSELLFGRWVDALDKDDAILHGSMCWEQHGQYIYGVDGRIVHQDRAEMSRELRGRHGDRVIACALAYRACLDLPGLEAVERRRAAPGSLLWRRKRAAEAERSRGRW